MPGAGQRERGSDLVFFAGLGLVPLRSRGGAPLVDGGDRVGNLLVLLPGNQRLRVVALAEGASEGIVARNLGGVFQVALRAGVGCAVLHAQVGPRNPQAVIAARIDSHVGGFRHVALHTRSTREPVLMVMVLRRIVLARRMLVADWCRAGCR